VSPCLDRAHAARLRDDWLEPADATSLLPAELLNAGFAIKMLRIFCLNRAHAARYEQDFIDDMQRLGCQMPSLLTRVSDFMPEISDYIDKIHGNGMAYANNGSVYFDTQAFRQAPHTPPMH